MNDDIRYVIEWAVHAAEQARRWRADAPDYAQLVIEPVLEQLPSARPAWQRLVLPPETTLRDVGAAITRVADDPRTTGVVFHLRAPEMSSSALETLRAQIEALRRAGKKSVAWATRYTTGSLYVAAACDQILIQRGGDIGPLGHMHTYPFLADGLESLGLRFHAVPITPYKSAADALARRDMSAAAREQATWLIEEAHAELVRAIAAGRGLDERAAAALIDGAPYTDVDALELGLVDGIVAEEELPRYLADDGGPVRMERWSTARHHVIDRAPDRPGRHIALLRVEGPIVDGESRSRPPGPPMDSPLLGAGRAGDLTVVQAARKAADDDDVAAVVVWIDSPGGSASASEAIAAALEAVAERKPVVAALGAMAASGGYYVATGASWIVAQPSTITGSIGVLAGKLVVAGLLDKLGINRETLSRGAGVRLFDSERPFSPSELETVRRAIERTYDVFITRVADARGLEAAEVEALAGGRVWTGRQALESGLIDELGGLEEAEAKARDLSGLGPRAAQREVVVGKERFGPRTLAPAAAQAMFARVGETNAAAAMLAMLGEAGLADALDTLIALRQASTLCLCPVAVGGGARFVQR